MSRATERPLECTESFQYILNIALGALFSESRLQLSRGCTNLLTLFIQTIQVRKFYIIILIYSCLF